MLSLASAVQRSTKLLGRQIIVEQGVERKALQESPKDD